MSVQKNGPRSLRSNKREAIFALRKGTPDEGSALVSIEYEGETYYIPKDGGRSMHALSLLNQLINLQKKAADLPGSATIRLTQ